MRVPGTPFRAALALLLLAAATTVLATHVHRGTYLSRCEIAAASEENGGPPVAGCAEDESLDLMGLSAQRAAVEAAPAHSVSPGAYAAGARAAAKLASGAPSLAEDRFYWKPWGKGPLRSDVADYTGVASLGLANLSGRPTDFAYDSDHRRLLASIAYGGVWSSEDLGKTWTSIGDKLPTQVVGSVGYIPADASHTKGTIVVITGDGSFGGSSIEGMGAYRSLDGGRTWQHSSGVPDGAFGFRVAVDRAHPGVVYAATGAGLYRSTNYGRDFTNVALPVGDCAGKSNTASGCELANIVTDVVVEAPGGSADADGGRVVAAVGWRAGAHKNPDGTVQSPGNGLYASDTGAPGSFSKLDATGFAPQSRIGRIQLGEATGPQQDHSYLYATVSDSVLTDHGLTGIDIDVTPDQAKKVPTVFRGVYVSRDFGRTWVESTDAAALQAPTTGSALAGLYQSVGYGPGVQSWYNQWIAPDPLHAAAGVPTQVLFGLEEVWRNEQTDTPQAGPSSYRVVGRYFAGSTCQGLSEPACPTNRDEALSNTTTTHPDQHAAIWVPDADGNGETLVVGNDGGVYTQHVDAGHPTIDNSSWGNGAQGGVADDGTDRSLHTLLPYDAVMARDGTIWFGLQDNGSGKITPGDQQQVETVGGDGFFAGVDPDNSDHAYTEYTNGAMAATSDGGKSWNGMNPPITGALFSNQFAVDPHDADHVITAGREVVETGSGPGTGADDWQKVFDLGTAGRPGDASAVASATDPANTMSAIALNGGAAYVGFCGPCDVLDNPSPFHNGIATNVVGSTPPERFSRAGWHIAAAKGLPNRFITSIAIDPTDQRTIWATLGGYYRPWTHAKGSDAAGGHLYVSHDAGETFTDMSGDLPDVIANWVLLHNGRPIVATDVGVFAPVTADPDAHFERVGNGLPAVRVATLRPDPADNNRIVAATYGRGVYVYRFGTPDPIAPEPKPVINPEPFGGRQLALYGFETDTEGWTVKGSDPYVNPTRPIVSIGESWKRSSPGHASTTSMQVLPYADQATTSMTSPPLTLDQDSTVRVSFWAVRDTEDGFDFLALDWSTDGHVWHNADAFTGQNADFPNFSEEQSKTFAVPKGQLYIRFRMTSDQLVSGPEHPGVALDDIKIEH